LRLLVRKNAQPETHLEFEGEQMRAVQLVVPNAHFDGQPAPAAVSAVIQRAEVRASTLNPGMDEIIAGVLCQNPSYPQGPVRRYSEYISG
jgi:hypothetical protein